MKLSKTEEELMNHLWKLEKGFMKDLLEAYPEPKPANTTIATLLKRMTDKGFVSYNLFGKSREYWKILNRSLIKKLKTNNHVSIPFKIWRLFIIIYAFL